LEPVGYRETAMTDVPPPPAWLHWPIRVLAVLFVLPFRLLWELLGLLGRFLARYVGRPLAWLWHYAVAVPAAFLGHYLVAVPVAFLWHYLVAVPVAFLGHYLVAVPATWLWGRALRPALEWPARWLLVVPARWLWRVTAPMWRALGRGVAAVLIAGWRGAGWVLRQVYRWVLRPAGLAVAWGWRHTVVPAYRMIAAAGGWVRESILQPGTHAARAVLVSVGLGRGRRGRGGFII
jgi:hypothetical protein